MSVVVNIENLEVGFRNDRPLLVIDDLQVKPGEILSIAGPSGIGKTTLLRTISGLLSPISGTLTVCGETFPNLPKRGQIGYIPQRLGLVRHSSVWTNVYLGARAGNSKPFQVRCPEASRKTTEAIESMGLSHKTNEPVKRLSGGQQRRVATARTLAQSPRLILADEFLSELDDDTMERVVEGVLSFLKSANSAMIIVEHDVSRAREIADRLLLIDDGRLNPFISETSIMEV